MFARDHIVASNDFVIEKNVRAWMDDVSVKRKKNWLKYLSSSNTRRWGMTFKNDKVKLRNKGQLHYPIMLGTKHVTKLIYELQLNDCNGQTSALTIGTNT